MKEELKPCPFCGGEDISVGTMVSSFGMDVFVKCRNCGAKIQICGEHEEDELFKRWNRRE